MHNKMDCPPLLLRKMLTHRLQRSNQMVLIRDVCTSQRLRRYLPTPHFLTKKAPHLRCCIVKNGGGRWIRTIEVGDSRFTVCPLWPLGNSTTAFGAGRGSRTPMTSLEGWCTAVMPYPQNFICVIGTDGGT